MGVGRMFGNDQCLAQNKHSPNGSYHHDQQGGLNYRYGKLRVGFHILVHLNTAR